MADLQVTCINKQPRYNPFEGITHLGGPDNGGWWSSCQQAIGWLQKAGNTLHTFVNGKRANVDIVETPNGPYLQTHADGQWNDNLLSLPECLVR